MNGRLCAIVLCVVLLPVVAGCGRNEAGKGRVVLRYLSIHYLPPEIAAEKAIVDKFNKSQNRIFVKLESTEMGRDKVLTEIAGGDAPDVFMWFSADVYGLASKGKLLQLDQYIKDSKVNKNDYYTQLFDLLSTGLDGKLYAFPQAWGSEALAYNKDLFDAAHIPYPNDSWTWDDFVRAAQKLTIRKGDRVIQYGTLMPPDHIVFLSYGASRFDQKLTRCTVGDPPAREALQFLLDLVDKYRVVPSLTSLSRMEQYRTGMEMFMRGKIGLFICTSFQMQYLQNTKFNWDVAPIPRHDGNKRTGAPGINALCIFSGTKHPKESWEFVKFACSKEGQLLLGKNNVPANKEAADESFCHPPPAHVRVFVDQYEAMSPFSESFTAWGEEYLETAYIPNLEKMLLGSETLDQAVSNMVQEGNKYLKP